MNNAMKIIKKLPDALLPWYKHNARKLPWRSDCDPYHVWVSEIMLQQTRVEAVIGYYARFLSALPDIRSLAEADEALLLKLWEGLGYYNRVRNLQKAAREIVEKYDGVFPSDYTAIRALPGIGAYTAGAISSICYQKPYAAVDGNVLRILSRMTAYAEPIDTEETKKDFARKLEQVYPAGECGNFTQALMELGACICTPKSPSCDACPANSFCLARKQNKMTDYPIRLPKREKKLQQLSVFLLECDGKYALTQRDRAGLLSGLWQLPNTQSIFVSDSDALDADIPKSSNPLRLIRTMDRVHIFTHIKWEMRCYHILCGKEDDAYTWATAEEIRKFYALPTAFRMFLQDLK